jgi:uncharacterized membrane protein AbrB (regulator of aidB expression)
MLINGAPLMVSIAAAVGAGLAVVSLRQSTRLR